MITKELRIDKYGNVNFGLRWGKMGFTKPKKNGYGLGWFRLTQKFGQKWANG